MTLSTHEFELGGVPVSKNEPPIFFAEVGSYFNGDANLAKKLFKQIVAARDANPDAAVVLKTEILNDPDICLHTNLIENYQDKSGNVKQENYRDLIERKAMPLADYEPLFSYCNEVKIPVVVSVYDFNAADFAVNHGAAGLKIASTNVVHLPLIDRVARFGLPMVIDTGRASLSEVSKAVEVARSAGAKDIIIQHSPDGHPALPEAHNLQILQSYERAFGLPVGLSDHYVGVEMLYMAIAMGATVLEKGLYFDPGELDQDICHSMDINDFPKVLQKTLDCWQAMGKTWRNKSISLKGTVGSSQRQCLVAKKSLKLGEPLTFDTVRFAFPCVGIPVEHWPIVKNWVVRSELSENQPIEWQHVAASK